MAWVGDSLPPGSTAGGNSEGWAWAAADPAPASAAGFHQHYFHQIVFALGLHTNATSNAGIHPTRTTLPLTLVARAGG